MYVRPHLEYCVQVWNPCLARDIDILQKVQRRATKCLDGLSDLSYEDCLQRLDLYSLYCRRQRGDLIEVYKISNGYYHSDPSTFLPLIIQLQPGATSLSYLKCNRGCLLDTISSPTELLINGTLYPAQW